MKNFILLLSFLFSQFVFAQNLKLYQLNPILNSQLASNDLTLVSDISTNESKKLTIGEMDLRWKFTATAPLSLGSNILSIPLATTSTPGYLSSSDWTTFNAKQATVSATAPIVFSSNTISIPLATTSVNGYLSSSDWTTFNAKVGTSTSQAITNKDYDGGTASNTSRITIPKNTKTNLDGLTRKQGTILFDTVSNKPYYDDGTNLKIIGSGSGGTSNLIEDGDAESGITNFVEGSYSAATRPAGTFTASSGASAFQLSTTTSTPIFGSNSFLLTKTSGSSRQGRAIERTINIDAGYRTKSLRMFVDYTIVSGTFVPGVTGPSASDSSLIWYIGQYNGSTWSYTEPSNFRMVSNSTSFGPRLEGDFAVNSDATQIKIIGYVAETATTAWVVKAELGIMTLTAANGPPTTPWVSYTPNVSNYAGSITTNLAKWRRVGDSMEIMIYNVKDGTAAAGGSAVTWGIPSGYVVDTSKMPFGNSGSYQVTGTLLVAGSGLTQSVLYLPNSNTVYTFNNGGQFNGSSWAANVTIAMHFTIPILGWDTATSMSDQMGPSTIAARYTSASSASVPTSATKFVWTTQTFDRTGNSMNTSTGDYTILYPGVYKISSKISVSASTINAYVSTVRINGSTYSSTSFPQMVAGSFQSDGQIFTQAELKAGDVVSVYHNQVTTGATYNGGASVHEFLIERLSGSTQIQMSDPYSLRASNTAGTSITSGTNTIPYATVDYDTNGSWTSNNTFTAQIQGKFAIKAKVSMNTLAGLSTNYIRILVNGSTVSENAYAFSYSTATPYTFSITDDVRLTSGQTVQIQFQNGFGSTVTLDSGTGRNTISIVRVGN